MAVVWTAEALEAINPRTAERIPPSKILSDKNLGKKYAELMAQLGKEDANFSKLRTIYLCIDDAQRSKLRSALDAYWPKADLLARVSIASVIRDAAKSKEIVEQWLESKSPVDQIFSVVMDLEQARAAVAKRNASRSYYELVATFGDDLLPLLLEIFEAPRDEFDLWHCARALALYDDARSAEKLATVMRKAKIKPYASDFFVRFPHHAETVLASLGKGKTKVAEMARELLESARRRSEAGPVSEEATPADLPPILVTPPWTVKKRPSLPNVTTTAPMPPRPERLTLDPRLVEEALADGALVRAKFEPMPPDIVEKCMSEMHSDSHVDLFVRGPHVVPDEVQLAWWDRGLKVYSYSVDIIDWMLAKHGQRALEGLAKYVSGAFAYASEQAEGLLGVDSPRIAAAMAKYLKRRERRSLALRWMRANGETAAFALASDVVAGDASADWVMRQLAKDGVDVAKAAEPWGEPVTSALDAWLKFDRRNLVPKKLGKMPRAWKPDTYTRPLLRNGKPIPASALDTIGVMLAISSPDDPYAGLEDVKAACEPRSLAELAWDVARSWENGGAKSQAAWMRDALIWFADDEVVRRTTPAMKVENVVDALGLIATPAAQMELVTIAAKGHSQAEQALRRIAESKRMTLEELEDRIVPTAGVDEKGELELDYGPRKLRVGFDSRLEPYVLGEDGSKNKALAPARKTDDPEKVEIAKRTWQDLKEDVGALATRRLLQLERAMCMGRTWSAADFRALFVEHPLTSHLARGLVWVALPDTLFRIAEDGTFADADEKHVPVDGLVQIAHPIRNGSLAAFAQVFADYRIVQPFPQISRPTRKRTEGAKAIEIDSGVRHDELAPKLLRIYDTGFARPMYAASGRVQLALAHDSTRVKISFMRKRSAYDLAQVPEIDISEALHDVLD